MSETLARQDSAPIETGLTTVSRLYCGLVRLADNSNRPIQESELARFVDSHVARLFPDGFTVLRTNGGWRDLATGQTMQEPSLIFEVAHGPQDSARVLELARLYKRDMAQQAVMVTQSPIATQFV